MQDISLNPSTNVNFLIPSSLGAGGDLRDLFCFVFSFWPVVLKPVYIRRVFKND